MFTNKFLKNTLMLTFTSLILNMLSMIFRVYINGKIGADGLGLFTLTISVYFFASTLASSGISLSVTRLVSESKGSGQSPAQVLKCALTAGLCMGTISAVCLFFSADFISAEWINDGRVSAPLKILSVSLPFFSVSSCFGGYFMAQRRVFDLSKWQFADQLLQICATVAILSAVDTSDVSKACCGIVGGSVIGEILACIYAFILYDRMKGYRLDEGSSCSRDMHEVYKDIFRISAPVAISSYFRAGLTTLENMLIPRGFSRLNKSKTEALEQYGILKGMAIPAATFPAAILSSFTSTLIPEISEAASVNDESKVKRLSQIALQSTFIYSILTLVVFFTFGDLLGITLFKNSQSGAIMKVIAWAIPFMYLDSVADGVLKSINEQVASMKYNTAEGISRIILLYTLIPLYGINGFIIVVFVSNLLSSALGFIRIIKVLKLKLDAVKCVILPCIFGIAAAFFARTAANVLFSGQMLRCIVGIAILILSFFALSCFSGILPFKKRMHLKESSMKQSGLPFDCKSEHRPNLRKL